MKLRTITITGLKGVDQSLTFERPVAVLVGENGAGKTEVLQALSLLATGSTAGVGKTGDAIMRLSRGDIIEIRAAFDAGTVVRSWARDKKGAVKESIAGTLLPKGVTGKAAAGYLAGTLGGWAEAWRPGRFVVGSERGRRKPAGFVVGSGFGDDRSRVGVAAVCSDFAWPGCGVAG